MILRDYQKECVEKSVLALGEHGNTLVVAPTGSGKTIILSAIIKEVLKEHPDYKVLVLAHRNELVAQNREKFLRVCQGVTTSIVNGSSKDWSGQVLFAMEQTVTRENNLCNMPKIDLFVIDEAHHAPADGYVRIINRAKELNDLLLLLGVTATPNRGDKVGLGEVFDNYAYKIGIKTLISSGHLVRPRTYVGISEQSVIAQEQLEKLKTNNLGEYNENEVAAILDTKAINADVVKYWNEYAGDRKTVVFCSTIAHAKNVYNAFSQSGIMTAIITGETTHELRQLIFERMNEGVIQVIINVAVLTEGWDYPPISCVVLLRMTSFQSTMIQMVGRGLRTVDQREYPGLVKTDCVILDFGISSILHGTLEQQINLYPKKSEDNEAPTKTCPRCSMEVFIKEMVCPECGYEFEAKDKTATNIYGMDEIEMLKMSVFSWHKIQIDKREGYCLLAHGFKTWSCIVKKGEHYLTICGSNNSKEYDIETQIIYKGDKAVAISKGNDFLYERESEEEAWKSAAWRQYPPSEKQINFISKSNTRYILEENTKGAAAAVIAFEINVKKELNKLANVA
jgi:superfamily II DNA or RNA helicase